MNSKSPRTPLTAAVWQLLRRNISVWQLVGYGLANMVGLSIVVTALMFYTDATTTLGSSAAADPYFASSFEVISKRVEGIGLKATAFTPDEIDDIRRQPWARRVGEFTPSLFTVNASVDLGGRGMSSYLFMESIPDDFFDVRPHNWTFDPEHPFIPVIISKEYLALYNFGFAAPQGLPQLSEEIVATVPFTFNLSGPDGLRASMRGGIAGFSSRLNTIAVPQSFMEWANARFAPGEKALPPSRLIVEADPLLIADMDRYLTDHGIETSSDRSSTGGGRIARFSAIASGVVSAIGTAISLMAVAILFLSIYLILQKSKSRMHRLMLLGFSPADVSRPLCRLVAVINTAVGAAAIAVMAAARAQWQQPLAELDLGGASVLPPVSLAVAAICVITAANIITIRRHSLRIWHN